MKIQISFDNEVEDDMETHSLMMRAWEMKRFITRLRRHLKIKIEGEYESHPEALKELENLREYIFELLSEYDIAGITS